MFSFRTHDPFKAAQEDDTSLGNILIEKGFITLEQLNEALEIQRSQKKLGEVLVEDMMVITGDQLDEVLVEQQLRRREISRAEFLDLCSKKRRRLMTKIDDHAKALESTSEEVAMKMGQGLVALHTK